MDLSVTLSGKDFPCKLPLFPDRFRVISALGIVAQSDDGEEIDVDSWSAVCHAALGLCWKGPKLDCKNLRAHKHDLVAYGDAVFDALFRAGHTDITEIYEAGNKVREAIIASIPVEEEIEEAADFTEGPKEPDTESM